MTLLYREKILFMYYSCTVHGFYDTIYTFKNYFTTKYVWVKKCIEMREMLFKN